jgi:hypothetical protein
MTQQNIPTYAEWAKDHPGGLDDYEFEMERRRRGIPLAEDLGEVSEQLNQLMGRARPYSATYYAISRAMDQIKEAAGHARNGH